jgi:type III pantothenate kinase
MILAIDVGNTNIVLGTIEDGEISNIVRIHTDLRQTGTEYALKLRQIVDFYGIDIDKLEGAIISSVVPPVTESLKLAVEYTVGKKPMIVGPGMKTGMNVRIDDPSTVAADLIVSSVAAMTYYGSPVIVIDMGTATTMVVIDKEGCYKGGAIVPGLKLSYASLASGTSLLPDISIITPKKVVATNTVDCMRSGAVYGTAAMLDGMIERMEEELGYKCSVVATGGLAQSIVGNCRHDIIYDGDLILKGLWTLYQKNTKKK